MGPFDVFVEFLLAGGNLKFLVNVCEYQVNQHGSHVLYVMPSAFKFTTDARKCMCVDKKTYNLFRNYNIASIGIQQILKTLRVEYLYMVDRVVSVCFGRPFDAIARSETCIIVEIGRTTFKGTPMFMLLSDHLRNSPSNLVRLLLIRTFDGWVHNNANYRDHHFDYLPGYDGTTLPKRISDAEHERLRMRCLDELMGADGLYRIVGMYVLGLMNFHSTAVTNQKRMARLYRFLADNEAVIESLANPDAEFKFNPREDWENLGLEAFCMLTVKRLAVNSLWGGLDSDLIEFIGRLAL
jgi:hypothetical protein